MEEYSDSQKNQIRIDIIRELIEKFDKLLIGVSIDKLSREEYIGLVYRIKSYVEYKLKELRYAEFYDLVDLLHDIQAVDYDNLKKEHVEKIFVELKKLLPVETRYHSELRRREKRREQAELYQKGLEKFRMLWSD